MPLFTDAYKLPLPTATLASGTVTVNDTNVTANTVVEVGVLTPGGTQGAPYLSTKTAGTSFVLKSTSGTDTSVLWYRVVTY
jgi:hypothetical protein